MAAADNGIGTHINSVVVGGTKNADLQQNSLFKKITVLPHHKDSKKTNH